MHWTYIVVCGLTLLGAARMEAAEPTTFTLPNGLRVRLAPDDGAKEKQVVVLLGVRAGFFEEPKGRGHLAHVTEHLTVFDLKPGSEEAKAVARWYAAGKANGETLADFMYFDLHVPPDEMALALRVQAARLAAPEFTRATLTREVPRTLAEIDYVEKAPLGGTGKFAVCALVQALYGRETVPLRAETRTLTLADVQQFHTRLFRPDRAVLAVAGAFDPKTVRKEIEAIFGAIPKPAKPLAGTRTLPKPGTRTAVWDVSTHHLLAVWPAPPPTDADHPALTVAGLLLTQRLSQHVALAPYTLVANDVEGVFHLNAQTKNAADLAALQEKVIEGVGRLTGASGISDMELTLARLQLTQLLGPTDINRLTLPRNVSRSLAAANLELQRMRHELAWGDLAAYLKRVQALDAAAVRRAAAKHLDPKAAVFVRVQPEAKK